MPTPPESRRCICFDCDSTLSSIEGIDELAALKGCADQIAPLTAAAMDGRLKIEEVYGRRLEVLRPSRADLEWLGERYVATVVPGAKEAVARLRTAGWDVFIVSGGLRGPVLQLASRLGFAPQAVFAVEVSTDEEGRYRDYDRTSALTRSDGKAVVCAELAQHYGSVVLVGDGMTDVAAKAGGAYVVGFGGVARRDAVVRGADAFVDGPSLGAVVDHVLLEKTRISASD